MGSKAPSDLCRHHTHYYVVQNGLELKVILRPQCRHALLCLAFLELLLCFVCGLFVLFLCFETGSVVWGFCYPALTLGTDHATPAPTRLPLNPRIKDTDTQLFKFNLPYDTIAGRYYLQPGKACLTNILISAPPTCPPACGSGLCGHAILRSHMAGQLFFIRSMAKLCLPAPSIYPFLQGPGSPAYSFCPAVGPWWLY